MQKWEYLFVLCEVAGEWRARYVNGKEIHNWKNGPPIFDYANSVGEEGWELVNPVITTSESGENYRLVFKRPKP
jgi:hypothetical protein